MESSLLLNGLPPLTWILLGLALLISALGFYRTVYFISVGYAFSITGMVILTALTYRDNLGWVAALQSLLLFVWSVRLGVYLLQRELHPAYAAQRQRNVERTANVKLVAKFFIWTSVSLLYVAMFSPALFTLMQPPAIGVAQIVGLVVMGGGLLIEWLADKQKADFKAANPKAFCNIGLYQWVRCPNYLGEILFWVGSWMVSIPAYTALIQWVVSAIGMVCIVLIMMGSTKRLEHEQGSRYGAQPDYQRYIASVPVLFPFVPIYSLKNVRVYLE